MNDRICFYVNNFARVFISYCVLLNYINVALKKQLLIFSFGQVNWDIHGHHQHLYQNFDHHGFLKLTPKVKVGNAICDIVVSNRC